MSKVVNVTDTSIDEFLGSNLNSVLVFKAEWCGPCKMMAPLFDELSLKNEDVPIGRVNIETEAQTTMKYGITSIPAILFMKNGLVYDRLNGANNRGVLQSKIDALKS